MICLLSNLTGFPQWGKLLHQNVALFRSFLYLCALEFPPAAVLASAILYLGKNQLEIEYEF